MWDVIVVFFFENSVVIVIICKIEVRDDSEYVMFIWIYLVIVRNDIRFFREGSSIFIYDNDSLLI